MVKLLVEEQGSSLADELWTRAPRRVASRLVYPETRAALAAATRAGRISVASLPDVVEDLTSACAAIRLVGVDWELALLAGDLAERHALHGYDAVHLATALTIDDPDLVVATWDRDLATAAVSAGLAVVPGAAQ